MKKTLLLFLCALLTAGGTMASDQKVKTKYREYKEISFVKLRLAPEEQKKLKIAVPVDLDKFKMNLPSPINNVFRNGKFISLEVQRPGGEAAIFPIVAKKSDQLVDSLEKITLPDKVMLYGSVKRFPASKLKSRDGRAIENYFEVVAIEPVTEETAPAKKPDEDDAEEPEAAKETPAPETPAPAEPEPEAKNTPAQETPAPAESVSAEAPASLVVKSAPVSASAAPVSAEAPAPLPAGTATVTVPTPDAQTSVVPEDAPARKKPVLKWR